MENLNLPESLSKKLGFIASEMGVSSKEALNEAILRFIEDYEDAQDAERVLLQKNIKTYTTAEVRAHLGLENN